MDSDDHGNEPPPINDLEAKLKYLIDFDSKHKISGCELEDIKDLARAIGESPYTFRDRVERNDMGTLRKTESGEVIRGAHKRLDEDMELRVADFFGIDLASKEVWRAWSNASLECREQNEGMRVYRGRFKEWFESHRDQRCRVRKVDQQLTLSDEVTPVRTRFAGVAEFTLNASNLGIGSADISVSVNGRDIDQEGKLLRVKRVHVEIHLRPAKLAERDWLRWSEGANGVVAEQMLGPISVRPAAMPRQKERHRDCDDKAPQRDDWIGAPYFGISRQGEEIGPVLFQVGRVEYLAPGDRLWAAAGVRKRDLTTREMDGIPNVADRRPGTAMKKRVLQNTIDVRAWKTLVRDVDDYRFADGYYVLAWRTLRFKEHEL